MILADSWLISHVAESTFFCNPTSMTAAFYFILFSYKNNIISQSPPRSFVFGCFYSLRVCALCSPLSAGSSAVPFLCSDIFTSIDFVLRNHHQVERPSLAALPHTTRLRKQHKKKELDGSVNHAFNRTPFRAAAVM